MTGRVDKRVANATEILAELEAGPLRDLVETYGLAKRLPTEERYNLVAQMRRSATSVTLNIDEGYGRYHYLDSLRFFYIARGSLTETLSITGYPLTFHVTASL